MERKVIKTTTGEIMKKTYIEYIKQKGYKAIVHWFSAPEIYNMERKLEQEKEEKMNRRITMTQNNQKIKFILKKLGICGYDITTCKMCGKLIVVYMDEMDYPVCKSIDCVYKLFKKEE